MTRTRLVIARHGNTFAPGETPLRVGARTDLPLVESGREQARALGRHLSEKGIVPALVVSGALKRAQETAHLVTESLGIEGLVEVSEAFNEIDYGPDEAKSEDEVIARVGQEAIDLWNRSSVVPEGWKVDPEELVACWRAFAIRVEREFPHQTTLVVTSNGIARFAPHLTADFTTFCEAHSPKLRTGAYGVLATSRSEGGVWEVLDWNVRP